MVMEPGTDQNVSGELKQAINAFQSGNPVLVHDSDNREGETDLMYPAEAVTPMAVARLRNDAGGLVCVAVLDETADTWDLPFFAEMLDHPSVEDHDIPYDERSSFSLTVNHRDTFTGITDRDRALTITELASSAAAIDSGADHNVDDFAAKFRSPGHVHLLRAAPGLLDERRGHTELGLVLANAADIVPAVVVCEMLSDETGGACSTADARDYARRNGYPFIEGEDLVKCFG